MACHATQSCHSWENHVLVKSGSGTSTYPYYVLSYHVHLLPWGLGMRSYSSEFSPWFFLLRIVFLVCNGCLWMIGLFYFSRAWLLAYNGTTYIKGQDPYSETFLMSQTDLTKNVWIQWQADYGSSINSSHWDLAGGYRRGQKSGIFWLQALKGEMKVLRLIYFLQGAYRINFSHTYPQWSHSRAV